MRELEESSNATQDVGKETLNARRGVVMQFSWSTGQHAGLASMPAGVGSEGKGWGGGVVPTPCKM